ncbi:integrase [Sphaerisporangium sp. NPDC005288]|uniref:integrase n=1 Tax=Sphaerisporangium sp. NPDC005288 TaxID=3155114 RepID=UPI0033AD6071
MKVTFATHAGHPNRPNEDWLVATPQFVILLDGAGGPSEDGGGCIHGVAWFVRHLGAELLGALTRSPDDDLRTVLATGLERTADLHRPTCDLHDEGTPSTTAVILRERADKVDYLVISDSTLVLDTLDGIEAISDRRILEIDALREPRKVMHGFALGSPEHAAARQAYIAVQRRFRNMTDGYWVASSDPDVSEAAIIGSIKRDRLRTAAVLSDGVADYIDDYHMATWREILNTLQTHGPAALIDQVRTAEQGDPDGHRWPRFKKHDDATVAYCSFDPNLQ